MTPDKSKKPLPSSTSTTFPEQPKTLQQWAYALKAIKVTYLKGQWKQCSIRCNHLLHETLSQKPLPIHAAYFYFYAALSEEAMARQMHNLSIAKIQTLQRARSCFEQAASSLPVPVICRNENTSSSSLSASDVDDAESLEDSSSSIEVSNSLHEGASPSSETFDDASPANHGLKPLPLRICKAVATGNSAFNEKRNFFEARLNAAKTSAPQSPAAKSPMTKIPASKSPPLKTLEAPRPKPHVRKSSNSRPKAISFSPSTTTWLHDRARERWNEQLHDFCQMLAKHIFAVDQAIAKTQEMQAMRHTTRDSPTFENDEDAKQATLRARIEKLKVRGWRRERFVPERYQQLCERALSEL